MTTDITEAPSSRTRRASGEKNGKPKGVGFRGLKLTVPAKCPGKILFDIGDDNITGTLRTLLGAKQYEQLIAKVEEDGLDMTETVTELTDFLNSIFGKVYGLTPGE